MERTIIEDGITILLKEFHKNPLNYLTEADFRSQVYERIYKGFSRRKIVAEIPVTGNLYPAEGIGEKVKINPVRADYPYFPGNSKFDIAIIDYKNPQDFISLKNKNSALKNEAFWSQTTRFGINIQYYPLETSLTQGKISDRVSQLRDEIKRQTAYYKTNPDFTGAVILFFQSKTADAHLASLPGFSPAKEVFLFNGINIILVTPNHIYTNKQKVFEAAGEKGGVILYQVAPSEDKPYFIRCTTSVSISGNDADIFRGKEERFAVWNLFWESFTNDAQKHAADVNCPEWLRYVPMFIHPDFKKIIQFEINKVLTHLSEDEYHDMEYFINEWKTAAM